MRVLFLLTQDLESPSGLGRYLPLAKELSRLGHSVSIAALHADYANLAEKEMVVEGVQVRYVGQMHVRKQGSGKTYYPTWKLIAVALAGTLGLTGAALREKADLIHIGKPHPMNSLAGLAGRALRRNKIYLDCDDHEAESNRFSGAWQRKVVGYFEMRMPAAADRVTTNTLTTRDRLIGGGVRPDKIFILSNGVDRERFAPPNPEKLSALREKLRIEGKEVVSYIGSLSLANHRVDLLLEAFAQVEKTHPQARLLVAGGGEDLETLRETAERLGLVEKAIFTGRVPAQEAALYYYLSHATVDPVANDAAARGRSPLKMFEAWAAGTPFISADVGDRRSLLGDPPAGWLVEPGDPDTLAQAICESLEDREKAAEMSRRGSERVCRFTWEVLARELAADYSVFMERTR